ncbi:acyl-CoA dehydrogenase family protein [Nocardioides limicola]|uniref:acyl-CoA dehydrogenase family protein n=1 Tax=Nocardioides limicola TaxID=2803368 RepID=UPI00193B6DBE|nr:acyl-CoA dehydrogenase family protein [Nocardioides sp. DJM-14]
MRFLPTEEHRGFAASLDRLLTAADVPTVARAWASGDVAPGRKLWSRLVDQGVTALLLAEEDGGAGATMVDATIAFEQLGRHLVPGPWIESAAYLPVLGVPLDPEQMTTVAVPPLTPYAVDAQVADRVLVVTGDAVHTGVVGAALASIDTTRTLHEVTPDGAPVTHTGDPAKALDAAVLACSAQLLGLGERMLHEAVGYVKQRRQFGREIGSYQAIKHALADVRIGLDFARPLIAGAAVGFDGPERTRDCAAAKVGAAEAADRAMRTALQVHGAIGYTAELDLSLALLKTRALVGAWGNPTHHRGVVLARLEAPCTSA